MAEKTTKGTTPAWTSPLRTADGSILDSDGARVCRWIERYCVMGEGDQIGQPARLRRWQRQLIWRLYERWPDGSRRYRRALIGVPKGNGKTQLAAWIGAYELFGGLHRAPRVIIGAASLKQANLVFGDLRRAVQLSPALSALAEAYNYQIVLRDQTGVAERIAAVRATNDGARATAFIADELHEWTGRLEEVYAVVEGATAKRRDTISLSITTAGYDRRSLLWQLYDYGRAVASGEVVDDEFLFAWWAAPDDLAWQESEESLHAAIEAANPALDDFLERENLLHRAKTLTPAQFERYHLNRWSSQAERWLPMSEWDACAGEVDIPEGCEVVVGVDGAAKRDTTAVVVVRPGEQMHVTATIFEPEEGDIIDPEIVEAHILDLGRRYYVREVVFDPQLFFRSAQLLAEQGMHCVEYPQTHSRMCPASQALYDAIMNRRIVHDGDPVLRLHAEAAVAKPTGRGWRLARVTGGRPMDAMIALAMAVYRADELRVAAPTIDVIDL